MSAAIPAAIAHGGGITAAAARFGGAPQDWLDLSTGINPCPAALPDIEPSIWHRLPDRHLADAARLAASVYYRSGDSLPLPVPGTQSVIQLLPRLAAPERPVAILSPTYGEYARAFQRAGFTVDAVADIDAIRADHGLVVVANPNNPTGRLLSPGVLEALWARLRAQGACLVVDEAFGDCQPDFSLAAHAPRMPGLVLLRSFGKFFGLAGMRLGFVIGEADLLARFEDWLGPWAVSGPALAISQHLMRADTVAIRRGIAGRSAALNAVLTAAGLKVIGGTSLFSLVDHERAVDIHRHLCRHHILVRAFDYESRWLRFGLTPDEAGDRRLAAALDELDI